MKIRLHPGNKNAFAVVIAVALLAVMTTLIIGNSLVLRNLKTELNVVDAKQLKSSSVTNSTVSPRRPPP